ncbi:hypothetical protein ABTZ58_08825 [Streptomyces sp. NPDC094143]|uniref:hypothetical protein n=1 Tax=Streptomyces sp. NPDC094143 TaxID=3155310 RepID=UPI003332F007
MPVLTRSRTVHSGEQLRHPEAGLLKLTYQSPEPPVSHRTVPDLSLCTAALSGCPAWLGVVGAHGALRP